MSDSIESNGINMRGVKTGSATEFKKYVFFLSIINNLKGQNKRLSP
jgi:hypothetical protein